MRPTTRRWLFLGLAGVFALAASTRVSSLNEQRDRHQLRAAPLPESAQPSMMLRPLLAVGRAPLVDYLWLRATRLKEEGRYFDAHQLSKLICELQPRFASVWAFQAWNMAYNISVTLNTPEERWRWVSNGISLLRDKGIPLNPNNTQLYRELAWIFFHKVGDFMDDKHWYYKLQLALQVEDILGQPPPGFVQPGRPRGEFYRNYDYVSLAAVPEHFVELDQRKHIASLTTTLEEIEKDLEKARPRERQEAQDELEHRRTLAASIAQLVEQLRPFGYDISTPGIYLGLLNAVRNDAVKIPDADPAEEPNLIRELQAVMADTDAAEARRVLEHFWRAYRLRHELKIDPGRMLEIQDAFTVAFDLRLAETHALYWATFAESKGSDRRLAVDIHKLNTKRIEFFCLQKMFFRGRMAMGPGARLGEPPLLSPDLRFGEILFETYLRDAEAYRKDKYGKLPVNKDFFGGFVGLTRTLTLRYSERGMHDKAREKFKFLAENFPDPLYAGGYEAFLASQFRADREMENYRTATNRIVALIDRGLINFAYGEEDEGIRFMNRARTVFDSYRKSLVADRQDLQEFRVLLEQRVHFGGGQMYRGSYELICRRFGFTPIHQPAAAGPPTPEP